MPTKYSNGRLAKIGDIIERGELKAVLVNIDPPTVVPLIDAALWTHTDDVAEPEPEPEPE